MSRDALVYEAVQRVYREMMVRHIRTCLSDAYEGDATARLRRPFSPADWNAIEAAVALARSSGTVTSLVSDEFDLLDVTKFHNVLEAEFDVLLPGPTNEGKRQHAARRDSVIRYAKLIKAVRDPISHPVTEEMDVRDARMCIDAARRIARLIDASTEARLAELLEALDHSETVEPLEAVLPPVGGGDYNFVGRESELNDLDRWLRDPDSRRWLIAGGGGRGKTAIAHQFAQRVRDEAPKPYVMVLWMTAKRRTFIDGEVRPTVSADFHDLGSAVDRILDVFGWLSEAPPDPSGRRKLAIDLLAQFPVLLIADDIDSLDAQDEAVTEFLAQVAYATKSKVLMTSRRSLMGMGGNTTLVEGLQVPDADLFVTTRIEMFGLDVAAYTPDYRRRIIEATARVPLYMEDLLRLAATVPVAQAVTLWRDKGGEPAREYALGREVELLTPGAIEVLISAALHDRAVSFDELRLVTGQPLADLQSAIGELQRLFLIPKPRLIESIERFELDANTRALVRSVLTVRYPDTTNRLRSVYQGLIGEVSKAALRDRRVGEYVRQAVFLVMSDRHLEAEETLRVGLDDYPDDKALLGQLGWVYKSWKPLARSTDARIQFERSSELGSTDPQMFRHWIELERSSGQWSVAAHVGDTGLERSPGDQLLRYQTGYAHWQVAVQAIRGGERSQIETAVAQVRTAINLLRMAIVEPEQLADHRSRLTNSKAYKALCYSLYEEMRILDRRRGPADESRVRYLGNELIKTVDQWLAEHPEDQHAEEMASRLREWRIQASAD